MAVAGIVLPAAAAPAESPSPAQRERALRAYAALPLRFDEREPDAEFVAHTSGYAVRLGRAGVEISTERSGKPPVRLHFRNANRACIYGEDALEGRTNYLLGRNPAAWLTDITSFRKVRYAELYEGTDLIFYGNQRDLEFDLVVSDGRDPKAIRFAIDHADALEVSRDGDLLIRTGDREMRLRKPHLYQPGGEVVEGRYRLRAGNEVTFEVGPYDTSRSLVIDPVLTYARHFGGTGGDVANAVAVDSSGNAYVTGQTASTNFGVSTGSLQTSSGGGTDAFVTKISADGNSILYSTYIGGSGSDIGTSIAVDPAGEAFVAGTTTSSNFPVLSAMQSTFSSGQDGFVAKLNASGNALVYSTYFGGGSTTIASLAIDGSGDALIGGSSNGGISTVNPVKYYQGSTDGFVALLNASGSGAYFSTYLGGGDLDNVNGVTFDSSGGILVTGTTYSPNFPTVSPIRSGGGGGPIRTTDGGTTWTPSGAGFTKGYLQAIAFKPSGATTVFASTSNNDIYKSSDGGVHWTSSYVASLDVRSITWDPSNALTVYLGAYFGGGVRKSTDGGTSWSSVTNGLTNTSISAVAIDPSNSSHLLAASGAGVFTTTDAATSWTLSTGTSGYITTVAFAPSSPSTVYAAKSYTVYRSTDGGATFTSLSGPAYTVYNFAVNPTNSAEVYAATGAGLYHSTDSAATWTKVTAVGNNAGFVAFWQKAAPSIIAGTDSGLYESTDSGATWQVKNAATSYSVFAAAPSTPSTAIFGISQQDGFVTRLNSTGTSITFSTFFGGSSYDRPVEIMGGPTGTYAIAGVTQSTDFPTTAGAYQTTLKSSQNDFVTWFSASNSVTYSTLYGGSSPDSLTGAAMDSNGRVWIAGTTRSTDLPMAGAFNAVGGPNFFESSDGGASWHGVVVPGTRIAVNPANSQEIYAYGQVAKMSHSSDGGGTWTALSGVPDNTTSVAVALDQSVFAGGPSGVYRSSDHGATWSNVLSTSPTGIPSYTKVESITTWEPTPANVFVLVATDTSCARSTDGGATWASVSNTHATSFAVDPVSPNIVFAVPNSGTQILRSTDGGATWRGAGLMAGGLPPYQLAVSSLNHANVYVASVGAGLYKSTDGGAVFTSISPPTLTSPTLESVAFVQSADISSETLLVGADYSLFASTDGGTTFAVRALVNKGVGQLETKGSGIVWAWTGGLLSSYLALFNPSAAPALVGATYGTGSSDQSTGRITVGSSGAVYLSRTSAANDDSSVHLTATSEPVARSQSGTTAGQQSPASADVDKAVDVDGGSYDLAIATRTQTPDPSETHTLDSLKIVYQLEHRGGLMTDATFTLRVWGGFHMTVPPSSPSGACQSDPVISGKYVCNYLSLTGGDTRTVTFEGYFGPEVLKHINGPGGRVGEAQEDASFVGATANDLRPQDNSLLSSFRPLPAGFIGGDANDDGVAAPLDAFALLNLVFGSGPVAQSNTFAALSSNASPLYRARTDIVITSSADVNGDGIVSRADVDYLIQYFYNGGPPPK